MLVFTHISSFCYDLSDLPEEAIEKVTDRVFIIGENHRSPKAKKINNQLKDLAKNGDFFLALEGFDYGVIDSKHPTIFGIEDHILIFSVITIKSYVMLYRSVNKLHGEQHHKSEGLEDFLALFLEPNDLSSKIWKEIPRPFKDRLQEEIALKIDNFIDQQLHGAINFRSVLNSPSMFNSLMRVSKVFAIQVMNYLESHSIDSRDISVMDDLLTNPGSIEKELVFVEQIALNWRNPIFLKNILQIYQLAKADNKDLFIIVGALHVEFLKNSLRKHLLVDRPALPALNY